MVDPITATEHLCVELLDPEAAAVDASEVPRSHLDALGAAGLHGLTTPAAFGGAGASRAVVRAVLELVAGACGSTFFAWVQHHGVVNHLLTFASPAVQRAWLPRLSAGDMMAGNAFAYLRRPGPAAVRATRIEGGWAIDGTAPWVTSWGLADVFVVSARDDDGSVVTCSMSSDAPGLHPSEPLALAALQATRTVRLGFAAVEIDDAAVLSVVPAERWLQVDRLATAQPAPAPFGIAARACALLGERAGVIDDERLRCRTTTYETADAAGADADDSGLAELVELRAWSLDIAMRACQALVVAEGGVAMERSHPAQRLLREAAFYSIQAQSGALRQASLGRLQMPRRGR